MQNYFSTNFTTCASRLGITPSEWDFSDIIPIPKRDKDARIPLENRCITIVCCVAKIYSSILNKRLQSDSTTTCGSYTVFFIHLISYCNYNLSKFTDILINNFNFKNLIKNDLYIIKYISKMYPYFNKRKCNKFFCNNMFLSNYKKCYKTICKSQ